MEQIMGGDPGVLTAHFWAFTGIVLGGGFYAFANLMYYALVIMRRQKTVFFVYGAGALAAVVLSGALVGALGSAEAHCAICFLWRAFAQALASVRQSG